MSDIELLISAWDERGNGLASYTRQDGTSIWVAVPLSIPGETVVVSSIVKCGKGTVRHKADISSIRNPSPCRVIPRCPHVGTCGGCVWQHISYDLQIETKQRWIESLFSPLVPDSTLIQPLIPSDNIFGYRNKMEFSFSQDKAGKQFLGLFGLKGKVVLLNECHLVKPWVTKALHAVRSWWSNTTLAAYNWRHNTGSLQNLTVRESQSFGDRMVILTVSGNPEYALKKADLDGFCQAIKAVATPERGELSIVLSIRQIAPKRPTQVYDMILFGKDCIREKLCVPLSKPWELDFHISPRSFFQPNTSQAQKIYAKALSMACLGENDTVLDLYCGIGVFGMFAALEAKKALGIEISEDSAYDATTNSRRLGLGNFSVHVGDVGAIVKTQVATSLVSEAARLVNLPPFAPQPSLDFGFRRESGILTNLPTPREQDRSQPGFKTLPDFRPDVVIVDPPRAGLQKAVEQISLLRSKKLVYVSCNPRTQVEDAFKLSGLGWRISSIQPVDQFPHTPHLENIVLFERDAL